jgi:hypothetical protein
MSIFKRNKPQTARQRWVVGDALEHVRWYDRDTPLRRVVFVYGPGWDPRYRSTTADYREIIGHCALEDHNRLSELMALAAARVEEIEDAERYADAARAVVNQ